MGRRSRGKTFRATAPWLLAAALAASGGCGGCGSAATLHQNRYDGGAGCHCSASEVCRSGRCLWNDPSLSALGVSPGTIAFAPETTSYEVTVPAGTQQEAVTPEVAHPDRATIEVAGTPTASSSAQVVALPTALTLVPVKVTAESGATRTYTVEVVVDGSSGPGPGSTYIKASNTGDGDVFGTSVALSADGTTLAVGAPGEKSKATGVDGDQSDDSAPLAGAVYVYTRTGGTWSQQAYLKASNTRKFARFGDTVALSADGRTLAVGATGEASATTGVDGDQTDHSAPVAGAVYVFDRSAGTWAQTAYLKASNTATTFAFGRSLSMNAAGTLLAVGSDGEASDAVGIDGDQTDRSLLGAGAVYLFALGTGGWRQTHYVKASNTGDGDAFGQSVALSPDGRTLAVGARAEDSAATGVNGDQNDDSMPIAGAAYVFVDSGGTWSQQAYLKASNTGAGDQYGYSVALSGDGSTLVTGAVYEDSAATGIDGNGADDSAPDAGAAYVYVRSASTWAQQAYVKASDTGADDEFGYAVALTPDGDTLVVGADNTIGVEGTAYVFGRAGGAWTQTDLLSRALGESRYNFGSAVAFSADGSTLAVSDRTDSSNATGIDGDRNDQSLYAAGAVIVYSR